MTFTHIIITVGMLLAFIIFMSAISAYKEVNQLRAISAITSEELIENIINGKIGKNK